MKRVHLYFLKPPQQDRYLRGDRYVRSLARKLFRRKITSGVEKVFTNLCLGFDELHINYSINLPFKEIGPDEPVVILGIGKQALQGYDKPNPIIAGIALISHPTQWPDMCTAYPVAKYLQHTEWAKNIYLPYYGTHVCELWPAGIDTRKWAPPKNRQHRYDILIYNKIRWDYPQIDEALRTPIVRQLNELGLCFTEITYGTYREADYYKLLRQSRAMIFLCEHESQGFACCEALSMNVPVFAWDQKHCLDPERFTWGTPDIPSSSVPFFDPDCGMTFLDFREFKTNIGEFWNKVTGGSFSPRNYVLKNITLKQSAERMLSIINEVYTPAASHKKKRHFANNQPL